MEIPKSLSSTGLSQYALKAYLALLSSTKPVNGSQLSVKSGVPRARIYDILGVLESKGFAVQIESGLYAALPPEEFLSRMRHRFDSDLKLIERMIKAENNPKQYNYVWHISNYDDFLVKASEMIKKARDEIYIRIMAEDAELFEGSLIKADRKGVDIRYITIGEAPKRLKVQLTHQHPEKITSFLHGRSFDLVIDKQEILAGVLPTGYDNPTQVNWTKNRSFVISLRDYIRHDFYHILIHKMLILKQDLSKQEKKIYEIIENDHWDQHNEF